MAFILGCALTVLTLLVQTAGITALIEWLRRVVPGELRYQGMAHAATLVMRTTIALLVLQGLSILLWAGCYRWFCFSSWASAFYFSGSTYSTVGYGDVVLPPQWRTLGPMESILGVLMCGLSVSLLFALINRLVSQEDGRTAHHGRG